MNDNKTADNLCAIDRIIQHFDLTPVLVDVGASIKPPEIWDPIAAHSIYVGFDPDLRDLNEVRDGKFKRAYTIAAAVTDGSGGDRTSFFLTNSPYCSSTLEPDGNALRDWLFAPLFEVNRKARAKAMTLGGVVKELGLSGIDWVKTDSQGTDLRVLTAMPDDMFAALLATDIEPGLIDSYRDEDLFIDAHRELLNRGFWLSELTIGRCIRLRPDTLRAVANRHPGLTATAMEKKLKSSPGWANARYMRTLDACKDMSASRLSMLWIFSLLGNQLGYCLDIAVHFERCFGDEILTKETIALL